MKKTKISIHYSDSSYSNNRNLIKIKKDITIHYIIQFILIIVPILYEFD